MDISTSGLNHSYLYSSADLRTISPKFTDVSSVKDHLQSQNSSGTSSNNDSATNQKTLQQSQEYQKVISELKSRDQHVKAHEQAHLSAAGGYATSGASFTYQVGPDGRRYAVGGEVGIDTSPVQGDPEATIQKARIIQRAALAPSDPSSQDIRVHAQAVQMEAQASQALKRENSDAVGAANSKAGNVADTGDTGSLTESQNIDASRLHFEIRLKVSS